VKAWLSQARVPFTVRNVDDDLDAYDALVALGYRTVPVTVAGARTIVGYRPDQLAAALTPEA
jgi:glutaredoxin